MRSGKKKKVIAVIAIIIVIVFILGSMVMPATTAKAASLDDLKDQYAALEKKQDQIDQQLSQNNSMAKDKTAEKEQTKNSVLNLQQQIGLLDAQIASYNSRIQQKESEIKASQKQIDENYSLFKQRMRAMYMAGDVSYIDVLFSAESITGFFMRMDTVKSIAAHDTEMLRQMKAEKLKIETAKKSIEQAKNGLSESQNQLASKQQSLKERQSQLDAQITQLNSNSSSLQGQKEENAALEEEVAAKIQQAIQDAIRSDSGGSGPKGTGSMLWPTTVRGITDPFGWRTHPVTKKWSFHDGIDIPASMGSPIYATDSGTVYFPSNDAEIVYYYGPNYVFINHHNGIVSFYGHCSARASGIQEGASVQRGQVIAYVGSEGKYSTGPHLHFSIFVNGKAQNPLGYLH